MLTADTLTDLHTLFLDRSRHADRTGDARTRDDALDLADTVAEFSAEQETLYEALYEIDKALTVALEPGYQHPNAETEIKRLTAALRRIEEQVNRTGAV